MTAFSSLVLKTGLCISKGPCEPKPSCPRYMQKFNNIDFGEKCTEGFTFINLLFLYKYFYEMLRSSIPSIKVYSNFPWKTAYYLQTGTLISNSSNIFQIGFRPQRESKSHCSLSFCKKCSKLSTAAKKEKVTWKALLSFLYDYKAMNRSSFLLFTWPKPILFGKLGAGHFMKQHIRRIFHIFESLEDWPSPSFIMIMLFIKYENCAFAEEHWCKN